MQTADDLLTLTRTLYPDWSDRTQRTFARALRRLRALIDHSAGVEEFNEVLDRHSKANGTPNVAAFAAEIDVMYGEWTWPGKRP